MVLMNYGKIKYSSLVITSDIVVERKQNKMAKANALMIVAD